MKKTTMMFLSALLALGMLTSYSGRTGAQDPNANGPAQTCADGEESGFCNSSMTIALKTDCHRWPSVKR
jgi:hypothetical protein